MSTGTAPAPTVKATVTPVVWGLLLLLAAGQGYLIFKLESRPAPAPAPAAFDFKAEGEAYAKEHAAAFAQALHEAGASLKQPGATLAAMRTALSARHSALESAPFDARFEKALDRIVPPGDGSANATSAQLSAYGDALIAIADGIEGK